MNILSTELLIDTNDLLAQNEDEKAKFPFGGTVGISIRIRIRRKKNEFLFEEEDLGFHLFFGREKWGRESKKADGC